MSKKLFQLVVFLLAVTSLTANAQTSIKGHVIDKATGEGEPYVTYSIYRKADAPALQPAANASNAEEQKKPLVMTITDENGIFEQAITEKGDLIIRFSTLGKKTLDVTFTLENIPANIKSAEAYDLGDIRMEDDEQVLNEASVTALRTLVKMEVDKMTYNIEDDVDSKSMTMLDMLRKVPMVVVDAQDNITVNGSSSFKVYVDGKPNQMISSNPSKVLKLMPASAFKSAEVITNPGAKYDAEGVGGVLNLITDKTSGQQIIQDGYNGTVELGADSKGGLEGGLYLSAQKGKFSISSNISVMREYLDGINYSNSQKNIDSDGNVVSDLMTTGGANQSSPGIFGDLNASYEIDSLRLLTATIDLTRFNNREQDDLTSTMSTPAGGVLFSYDSETDGTYKYSSITGGLDYQRSFAGVEGRALTASYLFSTRPTIHDLYAYYNGYAADRHSDKAENIIEQTAQLDYTTPWGKGGSFSTGAKFISRSNNSDSQYYTLQGGDWAHDATNSVVFRHLNNILAGYGEYSLSKEEWGGKAGVRYEHTFQSVKYLSGAGTDFDLDYGSIVPSASFQYNISDLSNIGLSYNLRISRPGISYLNPYVERWNVSSISYGNVDLKTEKSHHIGLVWNFFNPVVMVNLTGRYSFCNDKISQYSFFDSDGVLNTTYGNIAREQNFGVNGFVNVNLGQKTRIYSNLGASYVILESQAKGLSNSGFQFNSMTGLQHTLLWDLRLSLNYMFNTRTYQLDGYMDGFSALMGGITKSFLEDKLSVTINGATGLGKGGSIAVGMHQKGTDYITDMRTSVPLARVGLTLSWRFGTSQNVQVKKANRSINNDDLLQKSGSGSAASTASSITQ